MKVKDLYESLDEQDKIKSIKLMQSLAEDYKQINDLKEIGIYIIENLTEINSYLNDAMNVVTSKERVQRLVELSNRVKELKSDIKLELT